MTRAVIFDGEVHFVEPDESGIVTFCGLEIERDDADRIATGARYADDFAAELASNYDADRCSECDAVSEDRGP